MDIARLNQDFQNCTCHREHTCPIQAVEIGVGALGKLPMLCNGYEHILLVFDQNTYQVCGDKVVRLLASKSISTQVLDSQSKVVIPNEEKLDEISNAITSATDLIVGVGSGVINDLCKKVSFDHDLPYYIVATAPSMDGYASVGSALILDGMKVTINARPPLAIVADTEILRDAPFDMIQAGYGDIIGKFSCLNDWLLSNFVNGEYICQRICDMTYDCARQIRDLAHDIRNRDADAIGKLMEALVLVGMAMSFVGSSRPASGSEHHLSHYFEITGILGNTPYFAHGIDVIYSTIFLAKLRRDMLSSKPQRVPFDKDEYVRQINRIYTTSADQVIRLQDRLGWYERDDSHFVYSNWDKIRDILAQSPTFEELEQMARDIGLDYQEFEALYGEDKLNDAILYAKDLKDRYSFLWLYYAYFRQD